jgi:shikimate kinase/3-dehydroquinate synthase
MTRNIAALRTAAASEVPPVLHGRSLVLIGLMGAGKTSIGRRLAARLGLPFRDADAEIELAAPSRSCSTATASATSATASAG